MDVGKSYTFHENGDLLGLSSVAFVLMRQRFGVQIGQAKSNSTIAVALLGLRLNAVDGEHAKTKIMKNTKAYENAVETHGMNLRKHLLPMAAIMGCVFACATAQAIPINLLDTGAAAGGNPTAGSIDPNWNVSLLSSNGTPPGGNPNGNAYLVPNDFNFAPPVSGSVFGYWTANDPASSWITYSTPAQAGDDQTNDLFQYQLKFLDLTPGSTPVTISYLSDNTGTLYVNGASLGSNSGSTFSSWTNDSYDFTGGILYTIDLQVLNLPQATGNPTGARVEFSPNINVATVPDGGSTVALLAVALGGIALIRRKLSLAGLGWMGRNVVAR